MGLTLRNLRELKGYFDGDGMSFPPTQGNILQTKRRNIMWLATKVVTNKDLAVEDAAKEVSIRDHLPSIDNQLYLSLPRAKPTIIKPSVKSLFGMFCA